MFLLSITQIYLLITHNLLIVLVSYQYRSYFCLTFLFIVILHLIYATYQDKRVKKIYDNWKHLIRSILIKQRISMQYGSLPGVSGNTARTGHIHKFVPRGKDKITGEKVQKCSCGLIVPVASCEDEL